MTAMAPADRDFPWTEEEFLALDEIADRVELWDGDLRVSASPTPWHQRACRRLASALDEDAEQRGLFVHLAINLRLKPNRIVIPDLTVTSAIDFHERVVPSDLARLVCEVTSPSNAATDRVLKMHYYAEAGIPWYLVVEHVTAGLWLYRLEGEKYELDGVAEQGEALRLVEPVTAEIRPESLLP